MRRRLSSRMRVGSRSAPRGLRMGAVGRTRCGGGVQGLRVPKQYNCTERRDDDSRYGDEKLGCTDLSLSCTAACTISCAI
jgi:hypothetical protein